ncbi:MAG: hypothetical protein WB729_20095 [Candidatus Sulfotelmatobacter sp.]
MAKFSLKQSEHKTARPVNAQAAARLKKILYLGGSVAAVFAAVVTLTAASAAQRGNREERPEITPQEKVLNKKKKGPEPRAIGLLQITANGKATLVPIAILINGKFYDASSYKAAPVPMALESGTVYEGEHTGTSLGLFTVNGALQSRAPNAPNPWIGTGQWLVAGAEALKTTRKAEDVPVGMEQTDEPPRLTKSGKASKDASTDTPQSNSGSQTSAAPSSGNAKPPDTSQSPPAQKAPDQSKPQQSAPAPASPPQSSAPQSGQSSPDAGKPNPPANSKSDEAAPAAGEDTNSQAGDANRPKLRRGKPTQPLPADEDVPGYAKPGDTKPSAPAATAGTKTDAAPAKTDQNAAAKTPPQLVPAISDAGGPDPRSFVYEWSKSEEADRRKEVIALAQQQLHVYLQDRAKNSIVAKTSPVKSSPGKATPGAHKAAAKMPDLVLEDLQIRTFDLWTTNQPVIVLTATAHPALLAVGSAGASNPVPEYSITLAARTDIYNNLHKLYVGITDKYHLDVTPRLELIDAVDADGDGRGELLFRETSDAGSGYIIYRATADTLWKMFDSLSPE